MTTHSGTGTFARITGQPFTDRYLTPITVVQGASSAPLADTMVGLRRLAAPALPQPFARVTQSEPKPTEADPTAAELVADARAYQRNAVTWSATREGDLSHRHLRRELTSVEPSLIDQADGQRVTVEDVRQILLGYVSPGDETAAGELLRSLWLAADKGGDSWTWTGLQAAAFVATGDLATVRRLQSSIELNGERGGRDMLPSRAITRCLRWTINHQLSAESIEAAGGTGCIDTAYMRLNQAMHRGDIFPLSGEGPVNRDNAHHLMFGADQIQSLVAEAAMPKDPRA